MFTGFHHASVIVSDLQKALFFYCDTLGFVMDNSRPEMSFSGAWLLCGDSENKQQIHLLVVDNPDPIMGRPEHAGRDRHLALWVDDLPALQLCLEQQNIPYTLSKSGRKAIFCRDPDANGLEFIAVE